MTTKDIAISYLHKGLSVIPLWSREQIKRKPPRYFVDELNKLLDENKKSDNPISEDEVYENYVIRVCKRPMIIWTEFQTHQPTVEEVTTWFSKWPDANIGIVTGKISNLVVFDLDSEDAVQYAEDEGGFPDTVKAKTGKGYHVYVQHPGFEVKNDVKKDLDIDIRGDGGYVAAPPSTHGSGRQYEWEEGLSIFEIDPAECEPWMTDYLKAVSEDSSIPAKKKSPKLADNANTEIKPNDSDSYSDILKDGAREGMRNHTATKLVGHLLALDIPQAEAWEMLSNWNISKNNPPLDTAELGRIFASISNTHSKNVKKDKREKSPKTVNIDSLLDTPEKVIDAYNNDYVRIPIDFNGNFKVLEKKMNGGLIGGRLYVWGGIPSSGKTAIVNNLGDNICLNGFPILFFSYDDGTDELRYRTYARFTGFDIESFNQNKAPESDIEAILNSERVKAISALKYVVADRMNTEDWPALIDQVIAKHDKPPVIIADYLRKLRLDDKQASERANVDEILSCLTDMAKTYNTPVIVLSELARDSYKSGQRLSMASGKESGSIEYEASWLGILAAVEQDGAGYTLKQDWESIIQQDGIVDLIVFKAKRGTGERGKIPLKLNMTKMTFRDRIESQKTKIVQPMKKPKYA
jgi:replicative DNA helicase